MSDPRPCSCDRSGNPTILLVEDEPFVRDATRQILNSAGFFVLPAADARDALRVYEKCHGCIDLVMTDLVLPGATGLELGEDIRQRSAQANVLVTSGWGNAEYSTEDAASHTFFLAKPYSRRSLVEKIKDILDRPEPLEAAAAAI